MRPAILFILLLAAPLSSKGATHPCNPHMILGKILETPDQTTEWLARHFQYQDVKNFDADLYFKSKDEFENLMVTGHAPKQPHHHEFEKTAAWWDAQTGSGKKFPAIGEVLENGTETQKARLSEWVDHYSDRKLTEFQIKQASTELSLILNNTKYTLSELRKHGADGLAKKMVTSQYHQSLIQKQMMFELRESGLIKKENILNVLNRFGRTNPGKWLLTGSANAYSLGTATKWRHTLILSLPDHQIARLTLEDLEILMKTGGVNSTRFAEIAAGYKSAVVKQVLYNSVQDLTIQLARIYWIDIAIRKYHQHGDRQEELKNKDHS